MMVEDKKLYMRIRMLTIFFALLASFFLIVVFQRLDKALLVGIWIGVCCGLLGFQSIIRDVGKLSEDMHKSKASLQGAYIRRYSLYAVVFMLSASQGVNVFTLLVGMLCHKVSILICVMIDKERRGSHGAD